MIMGVTALFLAWSHNVRAAETNIYKCTCANGQIIFQDLICPPDAKIELIKLPINQSADNPAGGLREHEKHMLALAHESIQQDKEQSHTLRLAQLQHSTEVTKHGMSLAHAPQTHVHVHPATSAPHNINQNQLSVVISKVRH